MKARQTLSTHYKYLFWFSRYFILKFHMKDVMTVTFWMETRPEWRHNCRMEAKQKFFSIITLTSMNIAASNFLRLYYYRVAIKITELRCCHGNQKTIQPSLFGSWDSYYGSFGIKFENMIIYTRWGLVVQIVCSIKITKFADIMEEMEVSFKHWEGLYLSLFL